MSTVRRLLRWRVSVLAILLTVGVALTACASDPDADSGEPQVEEDPVLRTAANEIEQELTESYPDTFAGLVLDHEHRRMWVYRLPDPSLEASVEELAPGVVEVHFLDARYSLAEMTEVVDQVLADVEYWKNEGVSISGVHPQPDGSGVLIQVVELQPGFQQQIGDRYPTMPVTVEEQAIVPIAVSVDESVPV